MGIFDQHEQIGQLEALRVPFDEGEIDKLPRGVAKEGPKSQCNICHGYHRNAAVHLDYVGHARVTNRLLNVDPFWSWEPFAIDAHGAPLTMTNGNNSVLWIRLTIAGVTRIGAGTAASSKDELVKELIGDAIRNAAMRFGVALDLWAKGDADLTESPDSREGHPEWITKQIVLDSVGGNIDEAQVRWDLICHDLDLDPTGPFTEDTLARITAGAEAYIAADQATDESGDQEVMPT